MRLAYAKRIAFVKGILDFFMRGGIRFQPSMIKKKEKDPHAVYLGHLGGKARIRKIAPEKRREIARRAANARWAKAKKKSHPNESGPDRN